MSAQVREGSVCKRVFVALTVAGSGVMLYYGYKKWTSTRQARRSSDPIEPGDSSKPTQPQPQDQNNGSGDGDELLLDVKESLDTITKADRPTVTIRPPSTDSSADHVATAGSDVSLTDSFERVYLSQAEFNITPPILEENGSSPSASFEAISKSQLESQITQQLRGVKDEIEELEAKGLPEISLEGSGFQFTESESGSDVSNEGSGSEVAEMKTGCDASKEGSGCEVVESESGCNVEKEGSGCEITEHVIGCDAPKQGSGCEVTETDIGGDVSKEDSGCEITENESEMSKASSCSELATHTADIANMNQCAPPTDESTSHVQNGDSSEITIRSPEMSTRSVIASSAIAVGHPDDNEIRVELGMDITTINSSSGQRHVIENVQDGSVATQLGLRNGARLVKLNGMSVDRWSHEALVDHFKAINVETIETTFTMPSSVNSDTDCVEVTAGIYVEDDLVRAKVTNTVTRNHMIEDDAHVSVIAGPVTQLPCVLGNAAGRLRYVDGKLSTCAVDEELEESSQFRQVCFGEDRSTCVFIMDNSNESCRCLAVLDRHTVAVQTTDESVKDITSLTRTDPRFFYVHEFGEKAWLESTELPGRYVALRDGRLLLVASSEDEALLNVSQIRFPVGGSESH